MQNKLNLNSGNQSHYDLDISQYLNEKDCDFKEKLSISNLKIQNEHESAQIFSPKAPIQESILRSIVESEKISENFQIESLNLFNDELKVSENEQDEDRDLGRNRKYDSKSKAYAKNYREKKKQYTKSLQEQNRFLKSKIDDLSFRLKQTQLELNKLKHTPSSNNQMFQNTRESILKEIQNIIQASESTDVETIIELKQKMKRLTAFDSKHKMDLLNYFMSELLQNVIHNDGVYFVDCIIEGKGFWKVFDGNQQDLRRMDYEIAELLGENQVKILRKDIQQFSDLAINHIKNFKALWKKLYEDYINLINQGLMIETICRPLEEKEQREKSKDQFLNYFKLQLYFEKIKYRKDMRQLRDSWFHEPLSEKKEVTTHKKSVCKKRKLIQE